MTNNSNFNNKYFKDFKNNEINSTNNDIKNIPYDGMSCNDRYKNLKINKNQLNLRPRCKDEVIEFQREELER